MKYLKHFLNILYLFIKFIVFLVLSAFWTGGSPVDLFMAIILMILDKLLRIVLSKYKKRFKIFELRYVCEICAFCVISIPIVIITLYLNTSINRFERIVLSPKPESVNIIWEDAYRGFDPSYFFFFEISLEDWNLIKNSKPFAISDEHSVSSYLPSHVRDKISDFFKDKKNLEYYRYEKKEREVFYHMITDNNHRNILFCYSKF